MSKPVTELLRTVAHGLHLSEAEVLQQGLRSSSWNTSSGRSRLKSLQSAAGMASPASRRWKTAMREGTLEEAGSWQDRQRPGPSGA